MLPGTWTGRKRALRLHHRGISGYLLSQGSSFLWLSSWLRRRLAFWNPSDSASTRSLSSSWIAAWKILAKSCCLPICRHTSQWSVGRQTCAQGPWSRSQALSFFATGKHTPTSKIEVLITLNFRSCHCIWVLLMQMRNLRRSQSRRTKNWHWLAVLPFRTMSLSFCTGND